MMNIPENSDPLDKTTAKPQLALRITISLVALILTRLLYHIAIPGTRDLTSQMLSGGVELGATATGLPASLSIAAIAFFPWLTAAILGQVLVIAAPSKWSRHFSRDGFIDPFNGIVILGAMAISYLQATGVALSLETTILPTDGDRFQSLAIASLMAGTAFTIAFAWVIERFGIGRGFWVTFASLSVVNLTNEVLNAAKLVSSGIIAPTAVSLAGLALAGLAMLIVFVVLHVQRQRGSFEIVIWPLLIAAIIAPKLGGPKQMPEILLTILIVTLIIAALVTFVLTLREGKPKVFLPVLSILALVEIAAYFPLAAFPFMLPLPLPTAEFVAVIAVLTVLVQPIRSKPEQNLFKQH